jgi:hypothetical protein
VKKQLVILGLFGVTVLGTPAFAELFDESLWKSFDVHGFISQGFLKSDANNFYADTEDGTFQFHEVGVNFLTNLSDRLHVGMQLFTRDLGDISNNELVLDWAYGDYRWNDAFGIRAGKLKVSYGLYNETRDIDAVRTSIFLPQSIYPETQRDLFNSAYGVEVYGYLDLSSWGYLSYQAQYGGKDITTDSGMVKDLQEDPNQDVWQFLKSIQLKNMMAAGLEWETPLPGLRLKGWYGQTDMVFDLDINDREFLEGLGIVDRDRLFLRLTDEDSDLTILSLEYMRGNWVFAAEYSTGSDEDGRNEGYYGGVSYRINEWLELGTYYAIFYADVHDRAGRQWKAAGYPDYLAWQKDLALTARFDLNEHWIVKLEGHLVDGVTGFYFQDNPEGLERNSSLLALKITYSF